MDDRYYEDTYPQHEANGHNGECIYCCGFSYDRLWWSEVCKQRIEFERRQILDKPDIIRRKMAELQVELEKAEREAAKLI